MSTKKRPRHRRPPQQVYGSNEHQPTLIFVSHRELWRVFSFLLTRWETKKLSLVRWTPKQSVPLVSKMADLVQQVSWNPFVSMSSSAVKTQQCCGGHQRPGHQLRSRRSQRRVLRPPRTARNGWARTHQCHDEYSRLRPHPIYTSFAVFCTRRRPAPRSPSSWPNPLKVQASKSSFQGTPRPAVSSTRH